ncbi:MAG: hypothetical protein EOO13_10210 [Chitinophagaceae bacterium]|nr:MAG: hypothetical protein EOO13_10210 [Chitinophagaceae bacterium]
MIYLVNLAGSSLYMDYLIKKNVHATVQKIDEGKYEPGQLVEVKIPLKLPYYSSSLQYERYYGEVEIKGHNYNYVQRKVLNDTIYLLCLPDYAKNKLQKVKREMEAGIESNGTGSKKGTEPVSKKQGPQNEYDPYYYSITVAGRPAVYEDDAEDPDEKLVTVYALPLIKPPAVNSNYYSATTLISHRA